MKGEYTKYDNFRWINCNRWSNAKEVDSLVDHLVQDIPSRKKDGYRINMKILILDLYQSLLCDPEQYLGYSRNDNSYTKTGADHPYIKNSRVTFDYLVGCIDHLWGKGVIRNKPGGQFFNGPKKVSSFAAKMRPLHSFIDLVNTYHLTPEMIGSFIEDEVLILRDKADDDGVKRKLPEPKNKEAKRMAKIIRQYNILIERTHVDVDVECMTYNDRDLLVAQLADMDVSKKRIVLRLSRKSVYRVFNNGSLKQGGRFYGGWWVSAPSIVRKYIALNGNPTVELDFSAMHIHLLYAKVGVNYAAKGEDAYTLEPGQYTLSNLDDDRDLNKLILLTAFNAKTPEKAASAVFDELRKEEKLYQFQVRDHEPIKAKLALLKKKHPQISHLLASDQGRDLQYYDSCVIEKVIAHFTNKQIPVLTVHDSVICQVQHAEQVVNVMYRAFYQTAEELLHIKVSPTPKFTLAGHTLSQLKYQLRYVPPTGWFMNMLRFTGINRTYNGKVSDTIQPVLDVKQTSRENVCSESCHCHVRLTGKLKFTPNIKLELKKRVESSTNVLVIR
ncbi:hypothetical protein [Geomonas agri]|uniref:hypothetical protein n=1 Tax=Geomonas agri TaxID=2873702 RepID=UPI001CD40E06|nr:hypothetical protein [Geomonas agri]